MRFSLHFCQRACKEKDDVKIRKATNGKACHNKPLLIDRISDRCVFFRFSFIIRLYKYACVRGV